MVEEILRNLLWLGHDAFCWRVAGLTVYFDPFQLRGELAPADLILIGHGHRDHYSPEDIAKIWRPGTIIVAEKGTAAKLSGEVRAVEPGETVEVAGLRIEAVWAYNLNKKFHPKKNRGVGFVVTAAEGRLYHAGDTDYIPEMAAIGADVALLPVSGTYVMTAAEAAEAALLIQPAVAIPMHYGAVVGSDEDAEQFARLLVGKIRVEVLAPPR